MFVFGGYILRRICSCLHPQHAIEAAWAAVEDLLNPNSPVEARHVTFHFLTVMVSGQVSQWL